MRFIIELGLPWGPVLLLAGFIVVCALVFDAGWMWAIVKKGTGTPSPPMFKVRLPLPDGRKGYAYIGLFIFVLVPYLLMGPMGVTSTIPRRILDIQMLVMGLFCALIFVGEHFKWRHLSTVAAIGVALSLLAPVAMAGPDGWRSYAVITGLLCAILGILFLSFQIHRIVFGWQPRTRWGAGVRLVVDSGIVVTLFALTYGPGLMPH